MPDFYPFLIILIFANCFCLLSGSPTSNSTNPNADLSDLNDVSTADDSIIPDLSVIKSLFGLLTGSRSTFESITVLLQRLANLCLRIFDALRFKYTWVKPEIDFIQCGANSLLQANFTNRHFTVLIKVFYEFVGFIKNVFGEGMNIIPDDLFLETERSAPSHNLKMAALYEASELMTNSGFIECSKAYLIAFFVRFLTALYGDSNSLDTTEEVSFN